MESTSANHGFKITGYKVYKDGQIIEEFIKKPYKDYDESIAIINKFFD